MCNSSSLVCSGAIPAYRTCVNCGATGQPCCANHACNSGLACTAKGCG